MLCISAIVALASDPLVAYAIKHTALQTKQQLPGWWLTLAPQRKFQFLRSDIDVELSTVMTDKAISKNMDRLLDKYQRVGIGITLDAKVKYKETKEGRDGVGFHIRDVQNKSLAEHAGLLAGDELRALGFRVGKDLWYSSCNPAFWRDPRQTDVQIEKECANELQRRLRMRPGEVIVTVSRAGSTRTFTIPTEGLSPETANPYILLQTEQSARLSKDRLVTFARTFHRNARTHRDSLDTYFLELEEIKRGWSDLWNDLEGQLRASVKTNGTVK